MDSFQCCDNSEVTFELNYLYTWEWSWATLGNYSILLTAKPTVILCNVLHVFHFVTSSKVDSFFTSPWLSVRVIVLLEPSPQSEVQSSLEQVIMKDIFLLTLTSSCCQKTSPQHNATTTMLRCRDATGQVKSSAWFPPDTKPKSSTVLSSVQRTFSWFLWCAVPLTSPQSNAGFFQSDPDCSDWSGQL